MFLMTFDSSKIRTERWWRIWKNLWRRKTTWRLRL